MAERLAAATLPALLLERAARSPQAAAFRVREGGRWLPLSWATVLTRVTRLAAQLARLGLGPGDIVALMLPTGPEWEICHHALLSLGCVVVGLDAHDTTDSLRHILQTAPPRALIVATHAQQERLAPLLVQPALRIVAQEEDAASADGVLASLIAADGALPDGWPLARPEQLATLIFTSGSTGEPKGIGYTHAQLCLAVAAILDRFADIGAGARFACWLPLSNLFQRIIDLCGIACGGESFFVSPPTEILERLPEIRPTLFIGVPRFYEKLLAGIEARLASLPIGQRGAVRQALDVADRYRRCERAGETPGQPLRLAFRLADRLFLRRIRALTGPDLRFMVSGSAPLAPWIMERFHALGWLVLEAYGLSENVIPVALNTPAAYRFGSVGRPLPQNELRFLADGELLLRGPGVCGGYYAGHAVPPAPTLLDAEGFLHTGDYARLDDEGFLWLMGRKSEIFKTSTGRRVAPVPVEAAFKRLPGIEHAVLLGSGRPVPIVLLDLSGETVAPSLAAELEGIRAGLGERDRPAGALLLTRRHFSIAGGELTANLKLRRGPIAEKYRVEIEALYRKIGQADGRQTFIIEEAP